MVVGWLVDWEFQLLLSPTSICITCQFLRIQQDFYSLEKQYVEYI